MASELLSEVILVIFEITQATKAVLIQEENFKKFSIFLEKIAFITKELLKLNMSYSESLKSALEVLIREFKSVKQLALNCSKKNKVYLLINSMRIVKHLDDVTKEISQALSLISLVSLDVSIAISEEISIICKNMMNVEYHVAAKDKELLENIESGIKEKNITRSQANFLLAHIAEAVGISTKQSGLKKVLEDLKKEVDDAKMRKDMTEVIHISRIIGLLGKADAVMSPEDRKMEYFNKRDLLGTEIIEPLDPFICPINQTVMVDPVEISSRKTFERSAIEKWFSYGNNICPVTLISVDASILWPNKTLQKLIEEWKDTNSMIMIASSKSKLLGNDEDVVVHSLDKLHELCNEKELHREWVKMEDYIPVLIGLLGGKNRKIRRHALVILCILAKDSDESKETIAEVDNAIDSIVYSLARAIEESRLALQLLLELSRSNIVRDLIGSARGCLLLLVGWSNNDDPEIARDAELLLENLCFSEQNVIQMAKANYFRPLLRLLSSGPETVKTTMALCLSEINLMDHNKLLLFECGALDPLLELLSHPDIEVKKVAIKALLNLSNLPENGLQMIREGAVAPLLDLLYRHLSSPIFREQVAAMIMHLAISTTAQKADQVQVSLLESGEDIFKLFSLINLTGPNIQQSILSTFHAMCQSPSGFDVRTKLRQLPAVQVLVQICESDNHTVRSISMKLFYCLTQDDKDDTFIEHVGHRCIETLLRIAKTSNDIEEIISTIGIISNLPRQPQITQWLLDAQTLQIIHEKITEKIPKKNTNASNRQQLIENSVKALCRFTVPSNQEWQKKVAETGFIPVLVQLLFSGSVFSKRNAAISLKNLSESTQSLSKPVKKNKFRSLFATPETCCHLHRGACTVGSTFCLLEANAIDPLVRVLSEPDFEACKACLEALLTLIDGERLESGCKLLSESNGIDPIIKLLSSPCAGLQEKALEALERIFRLVEFRNKYGNLAKMPLVDIFQRGSVGTKSLAAEVLSHLSVFQEKSSDFASTFGEDYEL